jgi:transposase
VDLGFNRLIDHIIKNVVNSEVIFGLEATGHYWLSLYSFLLDKRYTVNVINPLQSDSFGSLYIRQTKNDTKDFFILLRFFFLVNTLIPSFLMKKHLH